MRAKLPIWLSGRSCGLLLALGSPALAEELPPGGGLADAESVDVHPAPATAALTDQSDAEDSEARGGPTIDSLVDALQRAYTTSPAVLAERLKKRASEYRMAGARGKFGPTLTYDVRHGFESTNMQDTVVGAWSLQSGWSSTGNAILTQPLYTFGRNAADFKLAKAQNDYSRATLESSEQQLLLDTLTAYAAVIRDRNSVTITQDYVTILEREMSDNSARFRKREVTITDVQQAGTRVELGREQLLNARRQSSAAEADFILVTGARPGRLEQPNPLAIPAQGLEDAYAIGEDRNPVISASYARELISRAQVDSSKAEFLPRIDLRGQAEYGAVTPYSDQYRQRRLTAQVVVSGTLFDGGQRLNKLHEAEALNDADWRLIDAALRENKVQIANAWNLWRTQAKSAERLAVAVENAQKAYDGAVLQERAGLRTPLEVLDLARDLFSAKTDRNNAVATAYVAQARLLAGMGLLTIGNLLPHDKDLAEIAAEGRAERRGSIVPLLAPIMKPIDSLLTDHGHNREPRDESRGMGAKPASTHLDLSPDLVAP